MDTKYYIRHIPIKRVFDLLFSLMALTLGSPIFLLVAVITYLSSGRVFYSHERVGRGGVPFRCYKFTTMYPDADRRLQEILDSCPAKKAEWNQSFKLKDDPRITPVGKYLRKFSLDEIPQFWNVLKGNLSIVGPRPVIQAEINQHFGVKAYKILSIRPGITGPWQVSGRSNISCYQQRIKLDEFYVENRSFLMDMKLIAKTIPAIVLSKGAY